jgi:hypothetical protein
MMMMMMMMMMSIIITTTTTTIIIIIVVMIIIIIVIMIMIMMIIITITLPVFGAGSPVRVGSGALHRLVLPRTQRQLVILVIRALHRVLLHQERHRAITKDVLIAYVISH